MNKNEQNIFEKAKNYFENKQYGNCKTQLFILIDYIENFSLCNSIAISNVFELMGDVELKLNDIKKAIYCYEEAYQKNKTKELLEKINKLY